MTSKTIKLFYVSQKTLVFAHITDISTFPNKKRKNSIFQIVIVENMTLLINHKNVIPLQCIL